MSPCLRNPCIAGHNGAASAQARPSGDLARRAVERRAVDAAIWGMPVVSRDQMFQTMLRLGKGGCDDIVHWLRLLGWKGQLETKYEQAFATPFFESSRWDLLVTPQCLASAPESKEANWVPTKADGPFEMLSRFYGPEKPLFGKTGKLPDFEEVK